MFSPFSYKSQKLRLSNGQPPDANIIQQNSDKVKKEQKRREKN